MFAQKSTKHPRTGLDSFKLPLKEESSHRITLGRVLVNRATHRAHRHYDLAKKRKFGVDRAKYELKNPVGSPHWKNAEAEMEFENKEEVRRQPGPRANREAALHRHRLEMHRLRNFAPRRTGGRSTRRRHHKSRRHTRKH